MRYKRLAREQIKRCLEKRKKMREVERALVGRGKLFSDVRVSLPSESEDMIIK